MSPTIKDIMLQSRILVNVKFKKLLPSGVIPKRGRIGDAGADMVATSRSIDEYGNYVYGTSIAIEIPQGYMGLLFPRSSISKYSLSLCNSIGLIDENYRGEIIFKFRQNSTHRGNTVDSSIYNVGDKIGQLVIIPYPQIEFEEVEELSETERGSGGFGSSGR